MDGEKENKQPTIKIKLNGVERSFKEEPTPIHDWQKASNETSAAASDETAKEEEFEWVLPAMEKKEVQEFKIVEQAKPIVADTSPTQWKRHSKIRISKMILSIILAVAIGLILGLLLLNIVNKSDEGVVALSEIEAPPPNKGTTETVEKAVGVKLPSMTIPVIQLGAFSTKEKAETAAADLTNHAKIIMEMDGMHYIFTGTSGNITTAKSWVREMQEMGNADVWAKELPLNGKNIELASKEEADQLIEETKLFHQLAEEATTAQMGGKIDEEVLTNAANIMNKGEQLYQNETAKALHSKLQHAHKGLVAFQNSSSENQELFTVQQALLEFIQIYYGVGT